MSDATPEPVAELAPPPAPARENPHWSFTFGVGVMQLAGLASIGAGIIHAGAVGVHADDVTLARLFVACAVAQVAVGLLALVRGWTTRRLAHARRQRRRRRCVGGDPAVRHLVDRRPRALRGRRRSPTPSAPCSARSPSSPPLAAMIRRRTAVTARSPRRAGVGDRIVRRRGDAARCRPTTMVTARPPGTPTTTPRRWRPTPPTGTATPRPTTARPPTPPGSPPD